MTVRLARMAMGSRWELVLEGSDETWLRAVGEEVLNEIAYLDSHLSIYNPRSAVSRLNARAASGPVQVEPRLFRLLQTAQRLHAATDGAFDITVGPLMEAWDFVHHQGQLPKPGVLREARARTGMHRVHLDEARRTVQFERPGVQIDLGGIGKGYAVDEAVAILREKEVETAFLHGGTSAIYGLGCPHDAEVWKVAIERPGAGDDPAADDMVAVVTLCDEALSVSAVWGKAFEADGRIFGHVLDPRKGEPVEGALLAAVAGPSATEADVLSTAMLVRGRDAMNMVKKPPLRSLLLLPAGTDAGYDIMEWDMPLV